MSRPIWSTSSRELRAVDLSHRWATFAGHQVDVASLPHIDAHAFATGLALRNEAFRQRMVHMMVLCALVLNPLPDDVAESVERYSRELGIDDRLLRTVHQLSASDGALAAIDFERNGYTADWSEDRNAALHASVQGWDLVEDDPVLAQRWRALADLPAATLGHLLHRFYEARGFSVPGAPGSAPPLLAQHDWVHVLADYGTTVEAELEVFAFIARANDDPRGFSLLAMVVSLFETGHLQHDAGLFDAFPGQLSHAGMTQRIGDAMRRGALSHGADGSSSVDFMQVDWFAFAHLPLDEAQRAFGIVPKSPRAIECGSTSPWGPGGISPAQWRYGQAVASQEGRPYDSFGATVP